MPLAHQNPVFGGIEAGGTKFVCAIGDANSAALRARAEFATGDDPQALLSEVVSWFKDAALHHGALAALGVASFGPVDLDPRSPTHGFITTTPKRGWKNTDVLAPLRRAFPGAAIGFDTDVNGAALGEGRWGAARDLAESGSEDFVYITVGTGIGGGAVVVVTGGAVVGVVIVERLVVAYHDIVTEIIVQLDGGGRAAAVNAMQQHHGELQQGKQPPPPT